MTGPTAADWAERADETAVALRADELDRRVLADAPAARDALAAIGEQAAADLRRWRDARLARLRRDEPGVAAAVRPAGGFTCGAVVATIAVATAFALFFSRGNLGVEVEVVLSAVCLVSGAAVVAVVLPWTPPRAVGGTHVTMAWILAALGVAAAVATARQAEFAEGVAWAPPVAGLAALLLVAMASVVTVRRLRVPHDARRAEADRAEAVRAELGERVALVRREAMARAEPVLDALDPAVAARAEADLSSAYAALRRRRLVSADASAHRPGVLLVDAPIGRAARASRIPDEGRLVPALAPRR
ncbi:MULTISPECIES: hypothetical protein [unclassified Agromyces]|uniref:hypothetical protein n=1 Tax=unclassified Agromyces TaxID=2639701 RepID=UPI003014D416